MALKPTKIGIVGLGHVGAHVAQALLLQGLVDELYVCDVRHLKTAAEVQDLNDANLYTPHRAQVFDCTDEYEKLVDCDLIISAVGHITLSTQTRDGELYSSIRMVRTFVGRLAQAGYQGKYLVISNPNDVVCKEVLRLSGLPKTHVIGTGTGLDTARLNNLISRQLNIAPESIRAYMLGEHGEKQFACFSHAYIGAQRLDELEQSKAHYTFNLDELEHLAKTGAFVAIKGKACTEYAIAATAARFVRALVHNERLITPCSVYLEGEYGQHDVYVSVPALIGCNGVEEIYELNFNEKERQAFEAACEKIKANYEKLPPLSIEATRQNPVVIPPDPEHDDCYARNDWQ